MKRRSSLKTSIFSVRLLYALCFLCCLPDAYAEADTEAYELKSPSSSMISKPKTLGFEVNAGMAILQPEIFFDSSLNKSARLTGGFIGIVKQFQLTPSLLTYTNFRAGVFSGSLLSEEVSLERKLSFLTFQLVQQFALGIDSWEIDDAQIQPLIGVGGYWGTLTDNFTHQDFEGVNRISDFGAVIEAGVLFVSERTGFFSTLKGQTLFSFSSQYQGSSDNAETLEFLESPTLTSKMPIIVLLGFGAFF